MRISRSLAIGCILCCVSKTAILLAGGGALLGTSVFATGQGAFNAILIALGFTLIGVAYHSIQKRSGNAMCQTAENN